MIAKSTHFQHTIIIAILYILLSGCSTASDQKSATDYSVFGIETEWINSDSLTSKGIHKITSVNLSNGINEELAAHGKGVYNRQCAACHQLNSKSIIGPGFEKITIKRRPEWILNMILNSDYMLKNDSLAMLLLKQFNTRMPKQHTTLEDAIAVLEFLRKQDQGSNE